MSQDLAIAAMPANATTLVLVVPTAHSDGNAGIAGALERAARALRGDTGLRPASFIPVLGAEAALMRRVEAEVYGAE